MAQHARLTLAHYARAPDTLGKDSLAPYIKRYVLLAKRSDFGRYVDEFVDAPLERKKVEKETMSAVYSRPRHEWAQVVEEKSDRHEHLTAHYMAKFLLVSAAGGRWPPPWMAEGIGCLCELLFRGESVIWCVEFPKETQSSDLNWKDPGKWESNLRSLAIYRREPTMEEVVPLEINGMNFLHSAKGASVLRFLILRWPELFRALVAAYGEPKKTPRETVESALGFTLEELDEFWRRWVTGN